VTATTFTRSSSIDRSASTSRTPSASSGTVSTVAPTRWATCRIGMTLLAYSASDTSSRSPAATGIDKKARNHESVALDVRATADAGAPTSRPTEA
jgi:hypothetical protein